MGAPAGRGSMLRGLARALLAIVVVALLAPLLPTAGAAPACDMHEGDEPRFFVRRCQDMAREGDTARTYEWTIVYVEVPEVPDVVPYGYYLYLRLDRNTEDGCPPDGACHASNEWSFASSSRTPAGAPVDAAWLHFTTEKPDAGGDCHARAEGRDVPATKVSTPCYVTPGVLP